MPYIRLISSVCILKYFPSNFVLPDQIALRIKSSDALECNKYKYNLHVFPVYFYLFILHYFTAARASEEKMCSLLDAAILK